MTGLAYERSGAGAALVLLHGLGSSTRAWDTVVPILGRRFDIIAVDLAGFGRSAPLLHGQEPTPAALAEDVATLLDRLGVASPHVAGNSLVGWVALELAEIRPVTSLTLMSPAGLWAGGAPIYARVSLRLSRWLAHRAGRLLSRLVTYRAGRILVLGQTHGKPWQLTADQARNTIRATGLCPGFGPTLAATAHRRYLAGATINAPVSVAFGSRDLVLISQRSRLLDELPAETRTWLLPECGHVPMFDDPHAVSDLITTTADSAQPGHRPRGGSTWRLAI
jgi:pimeloyl-ACP methyl ester carboxylesterase